MKKTLLAGATGYLGQHILTELQQRSTNFVAIARKKNKLASKGIADHQIIAAEVTLPETLTGHFENVDTVISTVGITRQKDGLTYMDVDYQANSNLLQESKRAGVKKFIYISSINGQQMRHLKIMEAKEKFVDELKQSGMAYTIVRPNG
ncbi:MAG: SDR family oxidoreductase, partial [Bacteroidota bacterium]